MTPLPPGWRPVPSAAGNPIAEPPPIMASPDLNTQALDAWAHRSEGMRCKSCMWFVPKAVPEAFVDLGRCRRHAPTMNGYPVVFVNDWCGDHKLNEAWAAQSRDCRV